MPNHGSRPPNPGQRVGPIGVHTPPAKVPRKRAAAKGDTLDDPASACIVNRAARSRKLPDKSDLARLDTLWSEGVNIAIDVGPGWADDFLGLVDGRHPDRAEAVRLAIASAEAEPDDDGPATIPARPGFDLGIVGNGVFRESSYPREWMVRRVLVKGKPGIVGGPKKALKTSFVVDLVASLASGVRFLDQFDVPRRVKTLVISGESGEATIQETLRRVCRSKGIDPAELDGWIFWGFTLPQLGDEDQLKALGEFIRANGIECVIIDPLYLCLISGSGRRIDPANLFDVGPLLKTICDICLGAGATPLLVHHFRKNREDPFGPPDMEDLAFAGTQEFARQWILLGRRERYEPGTGEHKLWLSVGGSDGHSGEWAVDVSEGVIGEDFQDRQWRLSVARASDAIGQVKQKAVAAKAEKLAETTRAREDEKGRKVADDADAILGELARFDRREATKNAWKLRFPTWNSDRFNAALGLLVVQGRVRETDVIIKGSKGREWTGRGWEIAPPDLTPDNPGQPQTQPQTFAPGLGLTPDEFNPGRSGVVSPFRETTPDVWGKKSGVGPVEEETSPGSGDSGKSPGLNGDVAGGVA